MINLYDILQAGDGQLFGEPAAQIFSDFCVDASQVREGDLFVALKSERGDSHHFIEQAVHGGATGVMCTHPPTFDTSGLTVIVMRSVENSLLHWTRSVLQKYGTTVIAVTGSAGKSVTQQAIAQVLSRSYSVYAPTGGIGGRFGLPLALGRLTADHRFAVLEFSPQQPGEVTEMVALARPMVGVITAIQRAHTDRLGTLDTIAQEYGALVRGLLPEGLAVLNFDDPRVRALISTSPASTLTVGLDIGEPVFGADFLAYNIIVDRDKTGFDLRHGTERLRGRWVPLLGAHQLYSALAALAVGLSFGVPLEQGLTALTELEPLPGRMHPLDGLGGSLLIDATCGANPDGVSAMLTWLDTVRDPRGRCVLVLGDIDGLGALAPATHSAIGEQAAGIVDRLVTIGDLAAEAGRTALEHGLGRSQVAITFSLADATRAGAEGLGPHDTVVISGGDTARLERIVHALLANPADRARLARPLASDAPPPVDSALRPTWVQVDVQAIAHNTRRLKEMLGDEVALMAVVRANAYGHGAVATSITALNNGASLLEVGTVAEAIELREAGITAEILVGGYAPPGAARAIVQHNLLITLYDADAARAFERAAADLQSKIRAHVRVDTGTGTLGLLPDDVMLFFRGLRTLTHLQIEGICTEFASAQTHPDYTRRQLAVFESVVDPLLAAGFRFRYVHAANSAAALHLPEARFNLVRAGLALYGIAPGPAAPLPADFRPALTWKTVVAHVRRLPAGHYIGDGNVYRTAGAQQIALLPVGFADGLRRGPRGWPYVLVQGERVPVVGFVGIDLTAIDVTPLGYVPPGAEVVLIGTQGEQAITVEELADALNTTPYEVIAGVLARVPRGKQSM